MAFATRKHGQSVARSCRTFSWFSAAIAAAMFAAAGSAAAAPVSPFTYAIVDIFAGGPTDGTSVLSSTIGPVFVERGEAPGAYGNARADFGTSGFTAQSGAAGTSMWSDGFVVTGGTGAGTIAVSVRIDGTVVGTQPDMSYTLFASDNPFDAQTILDSLAIDDQNPQVPGSIIVLHTENFHGPGHTEGAINMTLIGSVPFTYGQTFYLASLFGGDAGATGSSEDFSAEFDITPPVGATLTALSGTSYAAAVPEPSTWLLLSAGLIAVVSNSRRRSKSR